MKFVVLTVVVAYNLIFVNKILCTAQKISGPLSDDFSEWLDKKGYSSWKAAFLRHDLGVYGSYGGRSSPNKPIKNDPIVFIHGNSDQALDSATRSGFTGWTRSIQYFQSKGYTAAELYATTWGPANFSEASNQVHSCAYLQLLRTFAQAVISYTGASKIHMVSHSMGVTLARGSLTDDSGRTCNLGGPLPVDTFIGISGGNRGLVLCFTPPVRYMKACNDINGFYPGFCLSGVCEGNVPDMSKFLAELNDKPHKQEGQNIFTIWSKADDAIMFGDLVWGHPTSQIPHQDDEKVFTTYGHIDCKDKTAAEQFKMIREHVVT